MFLYCWWDRKRARGLRRCKFYGGDDDDGDDDDDELQLFAVPLTDHLLQDTVKHVRHCCCNYFSKFRPVMDWISPSKASRSTVAEFSA
jgi:hypothetical protein